MPTWENEKIEGENEIRVELQRDIGVIRQPAKCNSELLLYSRKRLGTRSEQGPISLHTQSVVNSRRRYVFYSSWSYSL